MLDDGLHCLIRTVTGSEKEPKKVHINQIKRFITADTQADAEPTGLDQTNPVEDIEPLNEPTSAQKSIPEIPVEELADTSAESDKDGSLPEKGKRSRKRKQRRRQSPEPTQPTAVEETVTTRRGRTVKPIRQADFIY